MKVIVMVDKSAGNESVGSMWTETYIFDRNTTLLTVLREIGHKVELVSGDSIQETIRLQVTKDCIS